MAKPGKQSKQSKPKEEVPVELTPRQLREKRREEARARAAETRKIVTSGVGQWTGKLPAQLLNEHAQKNKWERVEYICKNKGTEENGKHVCTVVLAKRNARTKEIERARFEMPESLNPQQPTALEARHYSATYTMHRILPNQNLKMMLPPFHRDLWIAMDDLKKEAGKNAIYQWNEDPWKALSDKKAAKSKQIEENEQRTRHRERAAIAKEMKAEQAEQANTAENGDKTNDKNGSNGKSAEKPAEPSQKRIKFNHSFSLSRRIRSVLEQIVRENNGFKFGSGLSIAKTSPEFNRIATMLQKLGFKKPFAEEALEHTDSLSSALAWLLVHVPEDDIPQEFMPTDLNITARVSTGLESEKILSQLRSYGYSEDVALTALSGTDLAASVVRLTQEFVDFVPPSVSSTDDDVEVWREDVEGLKAMVYEEKVIEVNEKCVSVEFQDFKVSFFRPAGYPSAVPGIAFESKSKKVSKFVLLAATKNAAQFAKSQLLGDYMLISLCEHAKSNFKNICANPGKLSNVSNAVFGVNEEPTTGKGPTQFKRKSQKISIDRKTAIKDREQRMGTTEGKLMLKQREQLPAWKKREAIVNIIKNNQLVLLTGETGSGKSTQTVQFVLDEFPEAVMICTQPRRISAIGVAQRVAEERRVELGTEVGYVIKGESKVSNKTQIKFLTSGVLLRMLQDSAGSGLEYLTHIFVDEVHERSLDSDLLLILLKRLLKKLPKLKVVLMSATVDAKQFLNYFSEFKSDTIHVEGRTFPVSKYYLDDILRLTNYKPKNINDEDGENMNIGKLMGAIKDNSRGYIDYNLVAALVHSIDAQLGSKNGTKEGSILIFMSGTAEIEQTITAISSSGSKNLFILPLHASLSSNEQRKVFKPAPKGMRKVVVSTNVAETSITIPDVVSVIDGGRVKETRYENEQNACRLIDVMESQASAAQRMGRAGRVQSGDCYKLFTKNAEETRMSPRPLPEIQRSPLEVLYLRVKSMGINDVNQFLAGALDPPPMASVDTAKTNLVSYSMLDEKKNELTPLGKLVSTIPADPKTAKLLILSTVLCCLPRVLTIASILSNGKLPPITPHAYGDLFAAERVFSNWKSGNAVPGTAAMCRTINSTRSQLISSLVQAGLVPSVKENQWPSELTKFDKDDALISAVVGAALQPSIAEVVAPKDVFVATSAGAMRKDDDDAKSAKFYLPNGTRVFMHPRSIIWQCDHEVPAQPMPYISFAQTVLTSKHFITDITPYSIYSLVLFANRIDVDPFGNGVVIDRWTGLKCWPRIGIVLRCLQILLSELFELKFRNPEASLQDNKVLQIVHDLILSEGKPNGVGLLA